jgi:4-oxalocrotonate tautomerase
VRDIFPGLENPHPSEFIRGQNKLFTLEGEKSMPHVIVKLWPGKSEQQKARLAEEIAKDVTEVLNCKEESVSVAIEEIDSQDWAEKVYRPDIASPTAKLYKKPGYTM